MVAQAVEQQVSVRAGRVRIPGWPWLFTQTASILAGHWAFSNSEVLDYTMRDTRILLPFFLSSLSIIVCQSFNCNQCTKREINPKRGRERPILKKTARPIPRSYLSRFNEKLRARVRCQPLRANLGSDLENLTSIKSDSFFYRNMNQLKMSKVTFPFFLFCDHLK